MPTLPKSAPLPTEVQDCLLVGILASIVEQGRFTPEVARLPGMRRALSAAASLIEEAA